LTGSMSGIVNGLMAYTSSVIPRLMQATASLNSKTGSYATTASNQFNGNQQITGSLSVSSNLTVSSTLVNDGALALTNGSNLTIGTGSFLIISSSQFVSGSVNVTGSVIVTGSINVNGFVYKNGNKQFNYGQWASLETQTGSANTAYAMKMEVPVPEFEGVYVGNGASGFPTRIYAQYTGLYNIQFSAQLHTTSNESVDFSVWFAMTGSNIANSNTDFSIEKVSGGGFQVAALNFLTPITSGSYVELYWSKTTANGQLQYKGTQVSPTRPATPSLIVTVTQVA